MLIFWKLWRLTNDQRAPVMPGVTAWHHGPIAPCQATLPADAEQRAGSRYTQLCQILLPPDKNYGGYLFEVTFIIVVMMLLYLH